MENDDKIYFLPGDVVTLKQDLPNKPVMIVVKKETLTIKPKEGMKEEYLKGIRCRWFSKDSELQEAVWNTKDLTKVI